MKIGILTLSHKRPEVLEMWCASMIRLREKIKFLYPVVVGDREHQAICRKYGITHLAHKNKPVTDKWNRGLRYFASSPVDYVMIVGSDDIVSTELMQNIVSEAKKGTEVIGVRKIYFYAADGQLRGKLKLLTRGSVHIGTLPLMGDS